MFKRFTKAVVKAYRGEKGITGLETAIILIAFVTVASVLAYSVLSAGIFSAERGKATVYQGLDQAQSSMEVRGDVLALSADNASVTTIQFTLASVLGDSPVDLSPNPAPGTSGNNTVVINYSDNGTHAENVVWTQAHLGASRFGANMLGPGEAVSVIVTAPQGASLGPYGSFTLQVVPTKGAAITLQRTLPASIMPVMDLH